MKYSGWIIQMKEYMNELAKNDCGIQEYMKECKDNKKYKNFVSYGEFDRIQFIPVRYWNEYHNGFLFSDWIGKQQTVMLFNIEEQDLETGIDSYILENQENARKGRFNILTMLHLSNEVKNTEEGFCEMLKKIKRAIFDFLALYVLEKEDDVLKYDVYGTFSSSEIAIIWSASQYVDVINILDYIRYFCYEDNGASKYIFIASYTIVSLNPYYQGDYKDVRGEALVQIEFSAASNTLCEGTNNIHSIRDDIRNAFGMPCDSSYTIMSSIGKYDFVIQIPAACMMWSLPENTAFCLKTVMLVQDNENEVWVNKVIENPNRLKVNITGLCNIQKRQNSKLKEYKERYDIICKEIEPYDICFDFRELISLMFSDYKKVISSSVDQKWLEDYEEQFGAIIDIISVDVKKIVEEISTSNNGNSVNKLLKRCACMGNIMQQQVDHILESSKLFLVSPNSNMGYTAQFDLMLHMYYGIIKSLMLNAYQFRNNSWQYPLVPVVTFMNASRIESCMLYTADNSLKSKRLIQFKLPCDAWANPMFYLPYLIHEVYHYITPYDRGQRNLSFLTITLTEACICYFSQTIEEGGEKYYSETIKGYYWELKSLVKYYLYCHIDSISESLLIAVEKCSEYRAQTFGYNQVSVSDMPIYQMKKALIVWLRYEEESRYVNFAKWLQEAIAEISNNASDYDISEDKLFFLKNVNENINKVKNLHMENDFEKLVDRLFDYMKEIYPDYAMIEHLGLGISEYLVQIAIEQSSRLITPESVSEDLEQMGAIRIAFIIEYLLENKKLEEYKESFCTLYKNAICFINLPSRRMKINLDYREQAEDWFKFFQRCYNEYRQEYSVYRWELKQQIENYKKEMKPVSKIYDIYSEYLKWIVREESDMKKQQLFELHLKLVLSMQNQISIASMNQHIHVSDHYQRLSFRGERANKKEVNLCCQEHTFYILQDGYSGIMHALYNIVHVLDHYHKEIFGYSLGHEDLWYRGISNEAYHIVPSMYRKYADEIHHVKYDVEKKQTNISIQQLQQHLLQRFRYQADGAPEILNQAVYQENDYLALMQHYQLPSNLLDWTEDVFAALYFALENYFLKEEKDIKNGAPAVYFLDPAAYNKARKEMINEICGACEKNKDCMAYKSQQVLLEKVPELVPNVSAQANKSIMKDYFCVEYLPDKEGNYVHLENEGMGLLRADNPQHCECCKLPIAYYCSRLSPRIRAQSGQFLAFSLNVHPYLKKECEGEENVSYEKRLSFDYMALDEIQKRYLNGKAGRHPFLLKLIIPREECSKLAGLLRKFGIRTIKYYPELTHLKD